MLLNTTDTYKSLQTFKSVDELNRTVKHHKKKINSKKHRNHYLLLDVVSQYSVKYPGVSFLSQKKLSEMLNVSYRTIQRCFDKLEELGIISIHYTRRISGDKRQSSNIYVINPISNDESVIPDVSHQETPSPNTLLNNTDVTGEPSRNELTKILVNKLPKPLQILGCYFGMDEVYSIVGTVYKAKSSVDKSISIEDYSFEFENTLKQVIQSYKLGKIRSLNGVIYGSIKKLCTSISLKSKLNNMFGF